MFGNKYFNYAPYDEAVISDNKILKDLSTAAHRHRSSEPQGFYGMGNVSARRMARPDSPPYLRAGISLGALDSELGSESHPDRITEALVHNNIRKRHPEFGLYPFNERDIPLILKDPAHNEIFKNQLATNRTNLHNLGYVTDLYSELHPCFPNGCNEYLRQTLYPEDSVYYSLPYPSSPIQLANAFNNAQWTSEHEGDLEAEREMEDLPPIAQQFERYMRRHRALSPSPLRDRSLSPIPQPRRSRSRSPERYSRHQSDEWDQEAIPFTQPFKRGGRIKNKRK